MAASYENFCSLAFPSLVHSGLLDYVRSVDSIVQQRLNVVLYLYLIIVNRVAFFFLFIHIPRFVTSLHNPMDVVIAFSKQYWFIRLFSTEFIGADAHYNHK